MPSAMHQLDCRRPGDGGEGEGGESGGSGPERKKVERFPLVLISGADPDPDSGATLGPARAEWSQAE